MSYFSSKLGQVKSRFSSSEDSEDVLYTNNYHQYLADHPDLRDTLEEAQSNSDYDFISKYKSQVIPKLKSGADIHQIMYSTLDGMLKGDPNLSHLSSNIEPQLESSPFTSAETYWSSIDDDQRRKILQEGKAPAWESQLPYSELTEASLSCLNSHFSKVSLNGTPLTFLSLKPGDQILVADTNTMQAPTKATVSGRLFDYDGDGNPIHTIYTSVGPITYNNPTDITSRSGKQIWSLAKANTRK